jgi:diguanylate cyclase (GGDEF)-like protein
MRAARSFVQATAGRVGLRPFWFLLALGSAFCVAVAAWIISEQCVTAVESAAHTSRDLSLAVSGPTDRVIVSADPAGVARRDEVRASFAGGGRGVIRPFGVDDSGRRQTGLSNLPRHLPHPPVSKRSDGIIEQPARIGGIAALGCLVTAIGAVLAIRRYCHRRRLEALSRKIGEQHALFGLALDNMNEGLLMFDRADRLLLANAAVLRIFELQPGTVQPGMSAVDFVSAVAGVGNVSDDATVVADYYMQMVRRNVPWKFIRAMPDGRQVAGNFVPYDSGWLITFEDMTEVRRADELIAHMAHHDGLTGLPNRVLLRTRTEEALAAIRHLGPFAIFCLDLDHFKGVNDTLGHPAGDKLLCEVAKRIKSVTRPSDIVARLGGDEFAVVVTPLDAKAAIAGMATRLVEAIGAPYEIDSQMVFTGASVGIAIACIDGADPDTLMKNADVALYRAKSEGRGRFAFFEPAMEQHVVERQRVGRELRDALSTGQLDMYYQPIVKVTNRQIGGFEALMRWHHPTRGMASPAEFIPIAEENGFIVDIGEWALHRACFDAAGWPETVKVAVNLSPIQFRSGNLVQAVVAALKASRLTAGRLELEITESAMMHDTAATISTLAKLKELGVRIAMDDFGTGYSSLAYLQKFPFDKVKIDRAFVHEIGHTTNITIVRAVANIASSMGIITLAEGVETEEQFRRVAAELCDEVQGFLFSEPIPASEVMAMLAQNAPSPASNERVVERAAT